MNLKRVVALEARMGSVFVVKSENGAIEAIFWARADAEAYSKGRLVEGQGGT